MSSILSGNDFLAQLGERKTEDLEAPCSIHGEVISLFAPFMLFLGRVVVVAGRLGCKCSRIVTGTILLEFSAGDYSLTLIKWANLLRLSN